MSMMMMMIMDVLTTIGLLPFPGNRGWSNDQRYQLSLIDPRDGIVL